MVMAWAVLFGQIAAESLMRSPWAKRVQLTVKNQGWTFTGSVLLLKSLLWRYALFSGANSHCIIIAPSPKYWTGSGKGLMLPSRLCLNGIMFFFCLLFLLVFRSVRTAFKGYYLPLSCKRHTGTGSSSPKRVCYSGVSCSIGLTCSVPIRSHKSCSLPVMSKVLFLIIGTKQEEFFWRTSWRRGHRPRRSVHCHQRYTCFVRTCWKETNGERRKRKFELYEAK